MKQIKNKDHQLQLINSWKLEMNGRDVNWMFIGIFGFIKLCWWGIFKPYRLIFFMQRCCDGMSHVIAWKYANEQDKELIIKTLKSCNWE